MSKTVVPSAGNQPIIPPVSGAASASKRAGAGRWSIKDVLKVMASLRLTVVLFALALVLVFAGTLAQIDAGIWSVVNQYFRSLYVWIPLQIFFPRTSHVPGGFPFPGGWLIGGLLLVNLLAAHAVRFKISWKRSGILLIHAGLIVMMVSELVTGLFAIEGRMTIVVNGASNYLEHSDAVELAVIDASDPKIDDVVVVPGKILRKGGLIQHDALPFNIEVVRYMVNSAVPTAVQPGTDNPATAGIGLEEMVEERPPVSGADPDQKVDVASAYLTFTEKDSGRSLGTYLISLWYSGISDVLPERPQQVSVHGKTYDVLLRLKRTYKPYTIHLKEFRHDLYLGTNTPKNFSSLVRLVDPTENEDREVLIYMNQPMRYAGETFYQTGFLPGDRGTILQVVRNPGWLMPYVSCTMVSMGMMVHFGMHLVGFLRRRVVK
jgi:hypothetical protein